MKSKTLVAIAAGAGVLITALLFAVLNCVSVSNFFAGRQTTSDGVYPFKVVDVWSHSGWYTVGLRNTTGKVVWFRTSKDCSNAKSRMGEIVNLRYVTTRRNEYPAFADKVYGDSLCKEKV